MKTFPFPGSVLRGEERKEREVAFLATTGESPTYPHLAMGLSAILQILPLLWTSVPFPTVGIIASF
jgi:hypothetical protein